MASSAAKELARGLAQVWRSYAADQVTTISGFSVSKLAFGNQHCIFLTSSGCVFGYGDNEYGQLGDADIIVDSKQPVRIRLPQCEDPESCGNCCVVDIACGLNNSAAVMKNGSLYMWGASESGQCGVEAISLPVPRRIEISDDFKNVPPIHKCEQHISESGSYHVPISQVACGNQHTIAVSKINQIWVWGTGSTQLGLIGVVWTFKPTKLPFFELKKVLAVSCGSYHNAAIVQKNNTADPGGKSSDVLFCLKCQCITKFKSLDITNDRTCPLGLPMEPLEPSVASEEEPSPAVTERDPSSAVTENEPPSASTEQEPSPNDAENVPFNTKILLDKPCLEAKSTKSATGKVVKESCNTVSEKFELLVQTKASAPTVQIDDNEEFLDLTEEAHEVFRDDLSGISSSCSSLKILEESKLLRSVYDRSSSSMDKLLLDNKNKYRSKSISNMSGKVNFKQNSNSSNLLRSGIQTELWTWGKGRHGQLGHGDMLERMQPCVVQSLSNKNVVKVVLSANHTVAMTSDCRIFSWGANSNGQLGHSFAVPNVCGPTRIQIPGFTLVWDVAASNDNIIFLADAPGKNMGVYCCGLLDSKSSENEPSSLPGPPRLLDVLKKNAHISRVYADGDFCSCIACEIDSELAQVVHSFAGCEKHFNYIMKMFCDEIFKFLLHEDVMGEETTCVTALKVLIGIHTELCDAVAINCFDLVELMQEGGATLSGRAIFDAYLIDEAFEYLALNKRYIRAFCDCLAVDAFGGIFKLASAFFDKRRPIMNELFQMAAIHTKSYNAAQILRYLAEMPCQHVATYSTYLTQMACHFQESSPEQRSLQEASGKYSACSTVLKTEMAAAEKTLKFWEGCPAKLAEALKEPERRYLKDSKNCPLTLQSSSRFTTHWFMFFNDVFIHSQFSGIQAYYLATMWVEVLPDTETQTNSFSLTTPEETIVLSCPTSSEKTQWVCALNEGIKNALSSSSLSKEHRIHPPLARFSSHTFTKLPEYKDATYSGMWLCGKLHGDGVLEWPNGKRYTGKFKQNQKHGHGILTIPSDFNSNAFVIYEGEWKNGSLNGLATVKYPNGDLYEGYFKDDQRHGHGVLKKGQFLSTAASVYIGQWLNNVRSGYGVNDDVMSGEKYLGWWENDVRHGYGIIVTIDGVYYEGLFHHNKMQGYGLVIFEDNTNYEGDLSGHGTFNGKGTMHLSNGDSIEGSFYGKWNDGVKINGVFHKSSNSSFSSEQTKQVLPKSFGKLAVPVEKKWQNIFQQCSEALGLASPAVEQTKELTMKAWENVAVTVTNWKKILTQKHLRKRLKHKMSHDLNNLDTIPKQSTLGNEAALLEEDFTEIKSYLTRAFDCIYHPIGQMVDQLVDVFRATYIGVGAHPKLLTHAVEEIRSYIVRIYRLVWILFPVLPKIDDQPKVIAFSDGDSIQLDIMDSIDSDSSTEVVTALSFLFPLLLPRIYSPLFMLYALHNDSSDDKYWERLLKWNKQSDVTLLNFLGVDQKFWLDDLEILTDKHQNGPGSKAMFFCESIETLQRLSTTFSPQEKLLVIHQTFQEINKAVEKRLATSVLWTMDELFPVFQFTVVRARIRHLGSEVHFIDDFMEKRLEHGELGIMLTTLKACYFQIQNEKVVNW